MGGGGGPPILPSTAQSRRVWGGGGGGGAHRDPGHQTFGSRLAIYRLVLITADIAVSARLQASSKLGQLPQSRLISCRPLHLDVSALPGFSTYVGGDR